MSTTELVPIKYAAAKLFVSGNAVSRLLKLIDPLTGQPFLRSTKTGRAVMIELRSLSAFIIATRQNPDFWARRFRPSTFKPVAGRLHKR